MSTQTLQMDVFAFCDYADQTKNDHESSIVSLNYSQSILFCKFSKSENYSWRYNRISSVSADFYIESITEYLSTFAAIRGGVMDKGYDVNTLTYANMPSRSTASARTTFTTAGYASLNLLKSPKYEDRLIFINGVSVNKSDGKFSVYTPSSTYKPRLTLTIDDSDVVKMYANTWASNFGGKTISKTAGADIELSVPTTQSGLCYAEVYQTGIAVIWRDVGSATEHEIQMENGTVPQLVIPAGTFSGKSEVQIRPKVTSNNGQTSTADSWLTITLQDEKSTAVPISPVNDIVDKNADTVFRWAHVITTGTPQTKAELQISDNGTAWTALAMVTGADTYYTVAAGSIETGTHFWRVRTYNGDGVASDWSSAAEFICVGTPDAPVILVQSATPRPSVSWQTTEQQAYQVEIDGVYASGTRFGTGKTWKAPFYLADGSYTVRVRVQNEYGFWSPWGTAALPVTNVPGGAITLTASAENAVTLAWVDSGNYDFYIVYRDGTPITKTEEHGYVDNMAIGACTYQVRGCYSGNDYYGVSAEVSVSVTPEYNVLYDMDAGEWLTMKYSGLTNQPVTRSISRSIAEVRLSGYTYPVAERSKAKTATYDGNVVFLNRDSAEKFEGMIGHLVCLKLHPSGGCIGYLNEVSGEVNQYKSVYSFMVTQIEYEEEIDIDS